MPTNEELEKKYAVIEAEIQWELFRNAVKPLCCREKLRPKHWQRALYEYFECERSIVPGLPEDRALIERTIDEMMRASRPWCNPELFDEAAARVALQRALDTILAVQVSTGTDVQSVDSGPLPEPVVSESLGLAEVQARTAALARELGV